MARTLDLTLTWEELMPALIVLLQDSMAEGQKIAREELARLARGMDSVNAKAREEAPGLDGAARSARRAAATDLANMARDFMAGGAYVRAACYWEAAARIAPAGMEAARDFRVSADLAEREAAALLTQAYDLARKEALADSATLARAKEAAARSEEADRITACDDAIALLREIADLERDDDGDVIIGTDADGHNDLMSRITAFLAAADQAPAPAADQAPAPAAKTCKDCRFWGHYKAGECDRVGGLFSDNPAAAFDVVATALDDSGLTVGLVTGPAFSCLHFEARPAKRKGGN